MQKLIMILAFTFFVSLMSIFSQDIEESDRYITVSDRYETLHENIGVNNDGDYSKGAYLIMARLYFLIPKHEAGGGDIKLFLTVTESAIAQRKINFTKIGFTFSDGSSTGLINYDSKKYVPNIKTDEYTYDVTEYLGMFRRKNLKSIQLASYGGNSITVAPKDIYFLMRQFETIYKPFEK